MFKKITAAITCAAATMLGAACAAPAPNATSSDLDAAAVIVDVRSAAEHASGHVKGDILVPVDELEARVDEVSAKAGGKDKKHEAGSQTKDEAKGGLKQKQGNRTLG